MLYLIGLGLNFNSITKEGLETVKKCDGVYLENYTVKFPYPIKELEKVLEKKLIEADRNFVESNKIVKKAKDKNISLLIYGDPLTATTHVTLLQEAKKNKVKIKIIHNASILDAIGETGLQIYKFGKITSIPKWDKSYNPDSFVKIIKENLSINAHTLVLIDIGLNLREALEQLEEALEKNKLKIKKIVVCEGLGLKNQKMYYESIEELKNKKIQEPYCLIIPGKLHFMEKKVLEGYFGEI